MLIAILTLIALCAVYYVMWKLYIKYITPTLPEDTWEWIKNPTMLQFFIAAAFATFLFKNTNQ